MRPLVILLLVGEQVGAEQQLQGRDWHLAVPPALGCALPWWRPGSRKAPALLVMP